MSAQDDEMASMTWQTHPVTSDRFADFADVVNRNRRANHCWCLSHRLPAADIEQLGGGAVHKPCDTCVSATSTGSRDPPGRMDPTRGFAGTRSMFEPAGFRVIGTTGAVASGMAHLVMRRDLP